MGILMSSQLEKLILIKDVGVEKDIRYIVFRFCGFYTHVLREYKPLESLCILFPPINKLHFHFSLIFIFVFFLYIVMLGYSQR